MVKKGRVLTKSTRQTGTSKSKLDNKRKAKSPGKRISKNGKIYYEYRKNRTDVKGKDTPKTKPKSKEVTKKKSKQDFVKNTKALKIKGWEKENIGDLNLGWVNNKKNKMIYITKSYLGDYFLFGGNIMNIYTLPKLSKSYKTKEKAISAVNDWRKKNS